MFRNYFKIGLRNLLKNKLFSVINISGMAISMACFLIIALYVNDELSFDKHIDDLALKYRVYVNVITSDGRTNAYATVPPPLGPALVAEYPEVESTVRFLNISSNVLFEVRDKKITEAKGAYADASVFDMFSLNVVEGDAKTALKEPSTLAISKSLSRKYFR
jgi:putative ABC transport system permease protein